MVEDWVKKPKPRFIAAHSIEERWRQAEALNELTTVCRGCGGPAKAVLVSASTVDPSWPGMIGSDVRCTRCGA